MSLPNVQFSHAGVYVKDIERMVAFYRDALGLIVTDEGDLEGRRIVFLSRSAKEHHQIVLVAGRPADSTYTVVNQLSFRVDSLADLRVLHDLLARLDGVSGLVSICHGVTLSVYFFDPEGNRLELYIDTAWYVAQPMRVPIDLNRPDAEIWGDVEAQLKPMDGFRPATEWQAEMTARVMTA